MSSLCGGLQCSAKATKSFRFPASPLLDDDHDEDGGDGNDDRRSTMFRFQATNMLDDLMVRIDSRGATFLVLDRLSQEPPAGP